MRKLCRRARLHYCDLLGHPIEGRPRGPGHRREGWSPGHVTRSSESYFKRMEAIEFAVKYNDGMGSGIRNR